MVRGSARDEFYALDFQISQILERGRVEREVVEIDPALERGLYNLGLFENLFEHEMFEPRFLYAELFGVYAFERPGNERSFRTDFV